ncbi:MAG: glycosyltransferase family 2 protein [Lachnospiraceae bacterium]|jgi:glycosyltransferase involved in cell wall biosynthesis|nr:glycosyltransferase family 2 protein [Lachnospiraceae bacterium]
MQLLQNVAIPLISVIIPIYNTEKYLEKCLDSILNQTYINIEVILVNDGSTDGSQIIINKYAHQDQRIRVIHLNSNRGVSHARNQGIKISKGEYIYFMDSDDYAEKNLLEKLFTNLIKYQADISICGVDFVGFGKHRDSYKLDFPWVALSNQVFLYMLDTLHLGYVVWNKLFLSTHVKKCYFSENIYQGEDLLFMYQIQKHAKHISYIPEQLYHYVNHNDSSIHVNFSWKKYTGFLVYKYLFKDASLYYPELLPRIRREMLLINIRFATETSQSKMIGGLEKDYYLKKFQKNIRRYITRESLTLIVHKNLIIKIFLLYISPKAFWLIVSMNKMLKTILKRNT